LECPENGGHRQASKLGLLEDLWADAANMAVSALSIVKHFDSKGRLSVLHGQTLARRQFVNELPTSSAAALCPTALYQR
jgi:hypothetical protein